jgi:hypothetical protein
LESRIRIRIKSEKLDTVARKSQIQKLRRLQEGAMEGRVDAHKWRRGVSEPVVVPVADSFDEERDPDPDLRESRIYALI